MKKLISFSLIVLYILSSFTIAAQASGGEAGLSVTEATGKPGDIISVDINLENNPGLIALRFAVSYDPEKLSLLEAEDTGLLGVGSAFFGRDISAIPYTMLWEDALAEENYTDNGVIVSLKFQLLESAETGDTEISIMLDRGSTFDVEMTNVPCQIENGIVHITNETPSAEKEILMIAVNQYPFLREYTVGDALDTQGLTVLILYTDGTVDTVTEGFTCAPETLLVEGEQTITVTYEEFTTSYTVTVNPLETLLIAIESFPVKTTYIVGDTLDVTGLAVTVLYADGSTELITDGFTCTPMFLAEDGEQVINVEYSGKTTSFTVNVSPLTVQYLAINEFPLQMEYTVGEGFNPEGLALVAIMNNGTIETITSGFSYSPDIFTEVGSQVVTVSYGGQSATFEVTVNAPELRLISVHTLPNKVFYFVDDEFVADGLTISAVYSDGSIQIITEGFEVSAEPFSSLGEKSVSVTYEGMTTSFNVTVKSSEKYIRIFSYDGTFEHKIDWWKRYSKQTSMLGFLLYNIDNAVRFVWESNSDRIHIDQQGNITNTGSFARSAIITLTAYDADGNVVAKSSVKVMFYKFNWQYRRLQSQEIVSDNIFGNAVSTKGNETEPVAALISVIVTNIMKWLGIK